MLRVSLPVLVQIVGAPIACKEGVKDTWREVAAWAGRQLVAKFGETVQVRYYDLFDNDCPSMPSGTQLPLVCVNDEVLSSGGKISVPAIQRRLEMMGVPLGKNNKRRNKMSDENCDCKNGNCDCGNGCDCNCGCECCGGNDRFQRRYLTKAEQSAELEAYLADLKLEVQAVEERLADLKK